MRPDRELLLQQATACRQLALIADDATAGKLKDLAGEYEALAQVGRNVVIGRGICEKSNQEPTRPLKN